MGKTTFVDGDPSAGIEGSIVSAAYLNALNNHRHMGTDTDGDGAIDYAADSGAADAYVIALSPALSAHVVGMPVSFLAAHDNTGASTININSLGAVAIKKRGGAALSAGDIRAGQMAIVIYDGTYYQLINSGQAVDLSQFANSLDIPGYQYFAGGLIEQWGDTTVSSSGTFSFTLPVTFPNECLGAVANSYDDNHWATVSGRTVTSITGSALQISGGSVINAEDGAVINVRAWGR